MKGHDVLYPALQKYYSSMKSLDAFGGRGNLFDDVACLDAFFSEFRNITFVVQKGLETEVNKSIYEKLRDEYLLGEDLKWFVETRNRTTKEKPIALKKELEINVYFADGVFSLKDDNFIVDFDESFNKALKIIRETFIEKIKLPEVAFSSRIRFSIEGENIDLYPLIKTGLKQMNAFMLELIKEFKCDCVKCASLKKLCEDLYKKLQFKELNFVNDYFLGKELEESNKYDMRVSVDGSECLNFSEIRTSLNNFLFKDTIGCMRNVFEKFISMHICIFQSQKHKIMPVFMIVFSDDTFQLIPFIATTKATFYRKVWDIKNSLDFNEVTAIFYCGEYYEYDTDQLDEYSKREYSDRIGLAKKELLSFIMMAKGNYEISVSFDESKVDDMQYVLKTIKSICWKKENIIRYLSWLNPLREEIYDL